MSGDGFAIRPVGVLRSRLTHLDAAPRQGDEGGSEAWIELDPGVARAAADLSAGDEILVPVVDLKPVLGDPADR